MLPIPPDSPLPLDKRPKRSSASPAAPGCARGLTDAAFAVLPQLVIVPAPALVLHQRHLHAVVFAAAVVQGTRVHSYEAKGQHVHHKNKGTWRSLSCGTRANPTYLHRALLMRIENWGVFNLC